MTNWIQRGLVFAAAMVVVRLFQGALISMLPTHATSISIVLLIFFVIGVAAWGALDGRADARANPDPDRRADLAMTWLLAGLLAGVVSGAVAWFISLFYKGLYVGGLINELTTFAAFTALVVFLPGMGAVAAGRWAVDRSAPEVPHHGGDADRTDTDVFAAVRSDETPAAEVAAAQPEERTAPVATAESEQPTEAIPTAYSEEPPTEAAPTQAGQEPTKRTRARKKPTTPVSPPEDDQR
jgi:hypothetical protein